jgi:hypothetical protein
MVRKRGGPRARVRGTAVLLMSAMLGSSSAPAGSPRGENQGPAESRAAGHDFDFSLGKWTTHIRRRLHPLTGSETWVEYNGTSIVQSFWDGRAGLGETEADGPEGHLEAFSLRLYEPDARQWALRYASTGGTTSTASALTLPTVGEFTHGRGEFYDTEEYRGRSILVRNTWSDITANSIRFEQAFSADGGKTWETNWVTVDTRVENAQVRGAGACMEQHSGSAPTAAPGQTDFDFQFGAWAVQAKTLKNPLSAASGWSEQRGTYRVRKVWAGCSGIGDLELGSGAERRKFLTVNLYNAAARQWSLYAASGATGAVSAASVGSFKEGRGEFVRQEYLQETWVLARDVLSDITPTTFHWERSISIDNGRTWQASWIGDFSREAS